MKRRSRTTYRPTMTAQGSTHVDTAFTGTTSSVSRTAAGNVAVTTAVRQQTLGTPDTRQDCRVICLPYPVKPTFRLQPLMVKPW